MRYAKPKTVEEALALLSEGRWRMLAGGTDFYPAQSTKPICDDVLDLNGLDELRGISAASDEIRIGARTSWSDVIRADLPPAFEMLRQAAREVGSIQIQNVATVAGNLCNASPAADGVPPLLALDAEVELRSAAQVRRLAVGDFILGNRRTARRPDELMTAIVVPKRAAAGASRFVKLGSRRYLVISVAMAAARIQIADGAVAEAAIAVGACSEVALRLSGLEAALAGAPVAEIEAVIADPAHFATLSPIDDVRGTADYRRKAAMEIVRRAVRGAAQAAGRDAPVREAAA